MIMAVTVETLDKLERKMTLTLPVNAIQSEVDSRLKKLARTVKMDGFRPGKVPLSVVAQRYGYSVQYEVMNDKVGEAFAAAANEAKLRVAGQPKITEKDGAPEGELAFDAVFEVYPEVKIADLADAEVEKISTEVSDAAIDRTLDILRKQRRTFAQRAQDATVQVGDRVSVDFEGKIDGETFEGGKAEDFQFMVGEGQMLKEFDEAVRGMKAGESKTFPLAFPADYHGKDVAGKTADFMVTVKKIESSNLPEVNEGLRQVARHPGRHRRRPARRHPQEPRARGQVPPAGAQQAGRDGRAGREVRARPAQVDRAERDRPPHRVAAQRAQAARPEGRREAADPRRHRAPAGRAPRSPGPGGGRTGARQQPGCEARPDQAAHRGTGGELRASLPTWCAGTTATTAAWPRWKRS
jgi:trigger factor